MIYFAQLEPEKDEREIVRQFEAHGALRSDIVINSVRERYLYSQVKKSLLKYPEGLTVDSIDSLGKDIEEIQQELSWFVRHDIKLEILDCPHFVSDKLDVIYEVVTSVRKKVERSVRRIKYVRYANRKDVYDDRFQELFWAYQEKRIKAREIARILDININTLYKRLSKYKELIGMVCEVRNTDAANDRDCIIMGGSKLLKR